MLNDVFFLKKEKEIKEKYFCRIIIKKKIYLNFKFKCFIEIFNLVSKLNLNMID